MFGRIKNLLPFNLGAPACTGGDEDPAQPAICKQTGCTADLADVDAEIRPNVQILMICRVNSKTITIAVNMMRSRVNANPPKRY